MTSTNDDMCTQADEHEQKRRRHRQEVADSMARDFARRVNARQGREWELQDALYARPSRSAEERAELVARLDRLERDLLIGK